MRFNKYLNEAYVGNPGNPGWDVFVNPSPKEINSFVHPEYSSVKYPGTVRFIADKRTKKFFLTYGRFLHESFARFLKDEGVLQDTKDCFMGSGAVHNGKITFDGYAYDFHYPKDMSDYDWTKKYFDERSQWNIWKQKQLKEDYVVSDRNPRGSIDARSQVTIYVNPTRDDLIQLKKDMDYDDPSLSVRMFADFKNKNLYIWDSWHAIHNDGLEILRKNNVVDYTRKDIHLSSYLGFGYIRNRKLYGQSFYASYHTDFSDFNRANEKNSAWLQKFFANKLVFTEQMDIEFK